MFQPTTSGIIPFNFFAGVSPTTPEDLAWTEGYTYVITSIALSTKFADSGTYLTITDAESNVRWGGIVQASSTEFPQQLCVQPMLVMGPNSGAQVWADQAEALVSIDGFALLPGSLPIW